MLNSFPTQAVDSINNDALIGVVVCKLEPHRSGPVRGYVAMLATRQARRGRGIATRLVRMAIEAMRDRGADEVKRFRILRSFLMKHIR